MFIGFFYEFFNFLAQLGAYFIRICVIRKEWVYLLVERENSVGSKAMMTIFLLS
jgi:hypothetical protein